MYWIYPDISKKSDISGYIQKHFQRYLDISRFPSHRYIWIEKMNRCIQIYPARKNGYIQFGINGTTGYIQIYLVNNQKLTQLIDSSYHDSYFPITKRWLDFTSVFCVRQFEYAFIFQMMHTILHRIVYSDPYHNVM